MSFGLLDECSMHCAYIQRKPRNQHGLELEHKLSTALYLMQRN